MNTSVLKQRSTLPFYISEYVIGELCMLCPVCGSDYVENIDDVEMVSGEDNYKAAPHMCRGDVIAIPFRCGENFHHFTAFFGFHKGKTLLWTAFEKTDEEDPQ